MTKRTIIDVPQVRAAMQELLSWQKARIAFDARLAEEEEYYRLRVRPKSHKGVDGEDFAPTSAWLVNSILQKHADLMEHIPTAVCLPREQGDEAAANALSSILPVILARSHFEDVYSDNTWYKLKHGVCAYGVFFNKELENIILKRVKDYFSSDDAVYPEFEGYVLSQDESQKTAYSSEDFLKLKKDLFETAFSTLHIPTVLISGNITNMKEIISAFLSFGVDPFADMITEGLNKGAGVENYVKGNYYKVNTSVINHRDIFENAANISTLISCGYSCIDELRIANGDAPLNTDWSRAHFLTKNFDFMSNSHNELNDKGGEKE